MKSRINAAPAEGYNRLAVAFHWVTAFLVIAIFALALAPKIIPGSVALHSTLGLAVLILVPLRVLWRLATRSGSSYKHESRSLRWAAKGSHVLLYALLLAIPVLGLVYVDAKGHPFAPLGFNLPALVAYNRELAQIAYAWKSAIAYTLLGLILVHALAAIGYHHLMRGDNVLRSMLKPRRAEARVVEEQSPASLDPAPASFAQHS